MSAEGAEGGVVGQRSGIVDVAGDEKTDGSRLDITFYAGDLSGEKESRVAIGLKGGPEMARPVDERIAMHGAESREGAVLQPGDHLNDALLLGDLHLRLEADDVEVLVREVFFAQLHDGVRTLAGHRMLEAHRLHRTESQGIDSA